MQSVVVGCQMTVSLEYISPFQISSHQPLLRKKFRSAQRWRPAFDSDAVHQKAVSFDHGSRGLNAPTHGSPFMFY